MTKPKRFLSFKSRETERRGGRLRRAYRRRLAAARARGRGGEEVEGLGVEVAQLVGALADHGELGWPQSVLSGGGGFGLRTNSSNPATNYPGEHGLGIVVVRGGARWRESAGEGLRRGNRDVVGAARVDAIPARCGSSGL